MRRLAAPVVVLGLIAAMAGPVAYSAQTITTGHTGSTPTAGPSSFGRFRHGRRSGRRWRCLVNDQRLARDGPEGQREQVPLGGGDLGSQSAASIELSTGGEPVMAIGGFSGQGGNLTLAQFKAYVAKGEIHYYIASSGMGGAGGGFPGAGGGHAFAKGGSGGTPAVREWRRDHRPRRPSLRRRPGTGGGAAGGIGGRSGSTSQITTWVKAHYKKVTIGGETAYDLTQPTS